MHVGTSAFDLKEHDTDLVTISSHITDVSVTTHVNFPKALGVSIALEKPHEQAVRFGYESDCFLMIVDQ
ncbi:hypothetical protein YC2023_080533 [Brassica napus]